MGGRKFSIKHATPQAIRGLLFLSKFYVGVAVGASYDTNLKRSINYSELIYQPQNIHVDMIFSKEEKKEEQYMYTRKQFTSLLSGAHGRPTFSGKSPGK